MGVVPSHKPRDETAARLRALGIDGGLFERFPCVLPRHDHTAHVFFASRERYWLYACDGLTRGIGFGEVRAAIAYGAVREISSVQAARWRERLDFDAGLRLPVALGVHSPERRPESARIVAEKMCLLVGLRDERFPLTEPFPFASDFARAYCDLTSDRVRAGKDWLEHERVIYRAGKNGRAILWKLAAQDDLAEHTRAGGQ